MAYIRRQMAPAVFCVEFNRICNRGPALLVMTAFMSPATKRRTIRKTAPVKMPMQTQETMILGPLRDAWGISSIMCATESCDGSAVLVIAFVLFGCYWWLTKAVKPNPPWRSCF